MPGSYRLSRRVLTAVLLLIVCKALVAQERITIQANAWGTSTQMGRMAPIKITIEQLSTREDQETLIEAFKRSGHEGMLDALTRMNPKGRIALEGRTGNDVKYIIQLPSKTGRRFRLLTDRNLAFVELAGGTRSRDYDIGAVELTITPDGKSGSGTLLPACKLKVNKKSGQVEVEAYQNPWELKNFIVN